MVNVSKRVKSVCLCENLLSLHVRPKNRVQISETQLLNNAYLYKTTVVYKVLLLKGIVNLTINPIHLT